MTLRFYNLGSILETFVTNPGVLAFWQKDLKDEFAPVQPLLRATDERPQSYPHPNPYESYDIVYYAEDDIFAVNPNDGNDRIPLTKQDVVVYEFDLRKFRGFLAKMMGFRESQAVIERGDRSISLGTWEPEARVGYPVHLLLPRDASHFADMIHRLFVANTTPMIVLTPTRTKWGSETTELFRQRKSALAPLVELIEVNSTGWAATDAWRETLHDFLGMINPPNLVEIAPYEFRKKGDVWVVRFDGKEAFVKDYVGAKYLSILFSKPGESAFAVDLQLIGNGHDPKTAPAEAGIELGDRQSVQDVQERSRTLLFELDQAKNDGNAILEAEIREEINGLADYLCQVKGLGGRLRKGNDNADSIRRSVQQGIKRVLESLDADLPEFTKHCRQSISSGFVLSYDPETKIAWEL